MFLTEWKTKPKNEELILLEIQSLDDYSGIRAWQDDKIPKQNKMACIYNTETDRVSDKSIYVDKDEKEYIKNKNLKYYISDFK